MVGMRTLLLLALLLMACAPASAQQSTILGYDTARDDYFWPRLYALGGVTIYCDHVFPSNEVHEAVGGRRLSNAGERLSVEHAYPADWIAEANGCPDRNNCDVEAYSFAEADLHNLWPALGRINSSRQDLPLGELAGETNRRFTDICLDYERNSGFGAIVEPQDSAKGELARSLLYMSVSYDLPIRGSLDVLVDWHRNDPPSDEERWRNNLIEDLQGSRNPFIDYPHIVRLLDLP